MCSQGRSADKLAPAYQYHERSVATCSTRCTAPGASGAGSDPQEGRCRTAAAARHPAAHDFAQLAADGASSPTTTNSRAGRSRDWKRASQPTRLSISSWGTGQASASASKRLCPWHRTRPCAHRTSSMPGARGLANRRATGGLAAARASRARGGRGRRRRCHTRRWHHLGAAPSGSHRGRKGTWLPPLLDQVSPHPTISRQRQWQR